MQGTMDPRRREYLSGEAREGFPKEVPFGEGMEERLGFCYREKENRAEMKYMDQQP